MVFCLEKDSKFAWERLPLVSCCEVVEGGCLKSEGWAWLPTWEVNRGGWGMFEVCVCCLFLCSQLSAAGGSFPYSSSI